MEGINTGRKERKTGRSCWLQDDDDVHIYIPLFSGALNSLFPVSQHEFVKTKQDRIETF